MPHAPMPNVDVEPDLARPYSQHRVMGQAGLAPCRGSCAHPAHGLLTLPRHSWPDGKMSSACSAHSASSAAQPGWQPGSPAGWPPRTCQAGLRGHPAAHGRHSTWGSQAGTARPPAQPRTAPWLSCSQHPTALPFLGDLGIQCHAQAGHSPMCLPVRAGCPSTQELAVGLPSWHWPPAVCKGSQSHHALAGAPRFNPCHAAAHRRAALAEQADRAGCTFTPVFCPATCPPCPACHSHGAESVVTGPPLV